MDRYLILSADCHAGLPDAEYAEYLDPKFRAAFADDSRQRTAMRREMAVATGQDENEFVTRWYEENEERLRGGWDAARRDAELDAVNRDAATNGEHCNPDGWESSAAALAWTRSVGPFDAALPRSPPRVTSGGSMHDGGRRAVLWALTANTGIAIMKFIGFALTGAASMLAEAIHSVADTGNQALLLYGGHSAQRAPTPEHPFGYGRERYFYAFVVALVMFALGSLFAIYEGVSKLLHPHELSSPSIAVAILLGAVVLEGAAFFNAAREAQQIRGKASWWNFVRHSKNPELPVVLLEDFGALVGLLFALVGVGLAQWTGDARFDALGSIAIGLLLGCIAVFLAAEMKSLLIGESVSPNARRAIVRAIETTSGVVELVHLRTQHLGPEEILVGAKVAMDPSLDFTAIADKINEIEAGIRAAVPDARLIYIEPDVLRPRENAAADPPR